MFWSFWIVGFTFFLEQGSAQPGARPHLPLSLKNGLNKTESLHTFYFQSLDAVFQKDPLILEITTSVVVSCGGPKSLPVHRFRVVIFTFLVLWDCRIHNLFVSRVALNPGARRCEGFRICHYLS